MDGWSRARLLLGVGALLLGCAAARTPGPQDGGVAQAGEEGARGAVQAEGPCGLPIDGLAQGFTRALEPGAILLLGELHGTQEVPAFAGQLVCQVLRAGQPVVLALELPRREQPALERYLASEGTDEDLSALTAGPFWRRPEQDGRSSQAMVDLLEQVRGLKREGLPVSLLAFDVEGLQESAHDQAMAEVLLTHRKQAPRANLVVLTGNVHASTKQGVSWDKEFRPLGWHLEKAGEQVRAFDVLHQGGAAWGCRLGKSSRLACGPYRAAAIVTPGRGDVQSAMFAVGKGRGPQPQVEQLGRAWARALERNGEERPFFLHMAPNEFPPGFDGYFYVSRVSPSPPARTPEAALSAGG